MRVTVGPLAASPIDQTVDRREAILQRLFEIGQGLNGIASAYRNHGPSETGDLGVKRPSFLLYDGSAKLVQDVTSHKRPTAPPTFWEMDPQIIVLLANRDTVENTMLDAVPAPVGPEISGWLTLINSLVTNDAQILGLVDMHWLSAIDTDLKPGRTVGAYGAWLSMLYLFRYPVYPSH